MGNESCYIGDGVYVFNEPDHVVIYTDRENGRNIVYLDSELLDSLFRFIERTRGLKITVETKEEA
jgi:hypothetical protein